MTVFSDNANCFTPSLSVMPRNDTIAQPTPVSTSSFSGWHVFDTLWTSVMGYHADEFQFVQGETPFSTTWETTLMVSVYLIVIFGGREIMRNRKPIQLNTLFKVHNLLLTLISGALLGLFLEQLLPTLWRDGFYENICGADGWTAPLVTLYYVSTTLRLKSCICHSDKL